MRKRPRDSVREQADEQDHAVGYPPGELERARSARRQEDRNVGARLETQVRIAKTERRRLAGDLLAAPETAHGAHCPLQGVHGAGAQAERAQWPVANAETEDGAAARYLIDRRDRGGGDSRGTSQDRK